MVKNLHYFNPGHEAAIQNGSPYYTPPANVVKMQQDLEYLPAWYANTGEYILTQCDLSNFTNYLSENNLNIAHSVTNELLSTISSDFKIFPWGLSPQAIYSFDEISKKYNIKCHIYRWNNILTDLSSRENAKECLQYIKYRIPELNLDIVPDFYSDLTKIESLVQSSPYKLLAKSPFSSSGRGLLWLPDRLTQTERQILHGIIKRQGKVLIEEVLDKKLDFAMEFFISESNDVVFKGYSLFETSTRGAYLGNYLDSQSNIRSKITLQIDEKPLDSVKIELINYIKEKFSTVYSGYVGVDMMIYKKNNEYRLHPCVEINVRNNMGIVAINISEKYLRPGSKGMFFIDYKPMEKEMYKSDEEMKKEYPLIVSDGKIKSGYLSLCPITENTNYRAYILIE